MLGLLDEQATGPQAELEKRIYSMSFRLLKKRLK